MTRRTEESAYLVDARGLKCPWPVLRAARTMRENIAIELLADDPVTLTDIPALASAHGWSVEIAKERDFTRFHIKASENGHSR